MTRRRRPHTTFIPHSIVRGGIIQPGKLLLSKQNRKSISNDQIENSGRTTVCFAYIYKKMIKSQSISQTCNFHFYLLCYAMAARWKTPSFMDQLLNLGSGTVRAFLICSNLFEKVTFQNEQLQTLKLFLPPAVN